MPFLIAALAIIAVLAIVLVARALAFKPKNQSADGSEAVFVNADKAVSDLAEMIKCKTVSSNDKSLEDEAEFEKFIEPIITYLSSEIRDFECILPA